MPKTVVSWYIEKVPDWQAEAIEKIVRDFASDLGDEGGLFELQHMWCEPPSTCDSDVVVEVHYGQSDDRDSIQRAAAHEMKDRLEWLLSEHSVSVRLLPKNDAIFIR